MAKRGRPSNVAEHPVEPPTGRAMSMSLREKYGSDPAGVSFRRLASAGDVLGILAHKWSQTPPGHELGQRAWEEIAEAVHGVTEIVDEHVPSQDQERVFGVIADLVAWTFAIATQEKARREAKAFNARVRERAAANAREGKGRLDAIRASAVRECA